MKKWRCAVCGYVHDGEIPPDKCPVCGADRDVFEEVAEPVVPDEASSSSGSAVDEPVQENATGLFTRLVLKHHMHPVSAHIPNGVLPVSVIFVILSMMFGSPVLQTVAKYNIAIVLLVLPGVVFTGYLEWKNRYMASFTKLFVAKMIAATTTIVAFTLVIVWWFVAPEILQSPIQQKAVFILLNVIGLSAAGLAGFLGGKLVFKDRDF
jgi:rubredoxin